MRPFHWLRFAQDLIDPTASIFWRGGGNSVFPEGPIVGMRVHIECACAGIESKANGDGPVVLALDNSPELILLILACLVAGRPFCIVSPDRAHGFLRAVAGTGGPLRPALIVANAPTLAPFPEFEPSLLLDRRACKPFGYNHKRASGPSRLVYLQATSGSTGVPKLVPVSLEMLRAHLRALVARMGACETDRMVVWVPLSHDMGLLSLLLMNRVGGAYCLSAPSQFMRSPLTWLRDIENIGATLTTAPTSALKIVTRIKREATEYSLDSLRFAWVGAEPVWPSIVRDFSALLAPSGLRPNVIRPTYGMAETVVGISFPEPHAPLVSFPHPGRPNSDCELLSNGPPLEGIDVQIWSEAGTQVDGCCIGRIMVRGSSVTPNYYGQPSDLIDGWRDTGDLGFLRAGEVYVVGRAKDVIIRNGVNHGAEQIEETIRTAIGRDLTRIAAFSVIDHRASREWLHVAIEMRKPRPELRQVISNTLMHAHGLAPDFVHLLERGSIPMTSSGKIKRRALRERFANQRGQT